MFTKDHLHQHTSISHQQNTTRTKKQSGLYSNNKFNLMNNQNSSSQNNNEYRVLRDISRVDYTGLDSTTGRYDYRERFYTCRGSTSAQGLWSLSTSPSSSASTSPTTIQTQSFSVHIGRSTLTPIESHTDIMEEQSHSNIREELSAATMADTDSKDEKVINDEQ